MFATLLKLELALLDDLSRDQLISALLECRDNLSLEFTPEWLEGQTLERLRLLLLAAKLLRVLRQKERRESAAPTLVIRARRRGGDTV
jgi:hypothetical protein